MLRFTLFIASLLMILGGEVTATRVFHEKLEQVLTAQTPVILARVQSIRQVTEPDAVRLFIRLDSIQVIHLRGPDGDEVVHVLSTNLEREINGRVVRVSPILEGSGLERNLQVGTHYYFLLDTSGNYIRRVEPNNSGPAIRKILGI